MSETVYQKQKKNHSRLKAKDIGLYPSSQNRKVIQLKDNAETIQTINLFNTA